MPSRSKRSSSKGPRDPLTPAVRAGLGHLLQASKFAADVRKKRWGFPLDIHFLRRIGLSDDEIRWLVAMGYVEHRQEKTVPGSAQRVFQKARNLGLADNSWFVLTPKGVELALRYPESSGQPSQPRKESQRPGRSQSVPHWDGGNHTLYWRAKAVKHFREEAPFQEAVLLAFEKKRWAGHIEVRKSPGLRRVTKQQLHSAIQNLNHGLKPYLRFRQEGNGARVCWEPLK